jgi:hypothetical protein
MALSNSHRSSVSGIAVGNGIQATWMVLRALYRKFWYFLNTCINRGAIYHSAVKGSGGVGLPFLLDKLQDLVIIAFAGLTFMIASYRMIYLPHTY